MTGVDLYRWLMQGCALGACEQFDAHVVACVLSVAFDEAQQGRPMCDALGLDAAEVGQLAGQFFPHAAGLFAGLDASVAAAPSQDEACLRDLLARSTSERTPFERHLAQVVARRALSPNHLWQDLGLRNRRELSWLMDRHFGPLAARNAHDMKWKKFLYRVICRDEGYSLCTAPSCSECRDFDGCFGDESGESRLAVARRASEQEPALLQSLAAP